jgi:subtilase family serine protease
MSGRRSIALSLALATVCVVFVSVARTGARAQSSQIPGQQPQDLGPTTPSDTVSASLILKVRNGDSLEALADQMQDPQSSRYHRFLSRDEFVDRFSPDSRDIAALSGYLHQFGIAVTDVYPNRLLVRAVGTVDAFNSAFDLDIHNFSRNGRRFHRPRHAPRIPAVLKDLLVAIAGPSDEAQFRPQNLRANAAFAALPASAAPNAIATHAPQQYSVGDTANLYNINPVYAAGIDGTGRTIGIVTLADFLPSDAYAYWATFHVSTSTTRITQIHVDGGGDLSADAGSGETSIDVEQSGGLAPGAKVVVYDAPNSPAGFMDAFYQAISENTVDSLSASWGSPEQLYDAAVVGFDRSGELLAFHQIFLEAAAQGISVFASTGDSGAFDFNSGVNVPIDNVLSVDVPASDPAITASGGTTTPVNLGNGAIIIPREQVWGWSYLVPFFGLDAVFPAGTGGGVSVVWKRPSYQSQTNGIRKSEPNQSIVQDGFDFEDLRAHFPGRNLPDISMNADPETGYLVFSTLDGGVIPGFGGTSFVAPQLNGITALFGQATHGRVGLLNPMLYRFKRLYQGAPHPPIVDIVGGDNWFYQGVPGYEPGAGLGVPDVAKLLQAIKLEANFNW